MLHVTAAPPSPRHGFPRQDGAMPSQSHRRRPGRDRPRPGVSFRAYAERRPLALGVVGWVRNRRAARSPLRAEEPADAIDAFVRWCHEGPSWAAGQASTRATRRGTQARRRFPDPLRPAARTSWVILDFVVLQHPTVRATTSRGNLQQERSHPRVTTAPVRQLGRDDVEVGPPGSLGDERQDVVPLHPGPAWAKPSATTNQMCGVHDRRPAVDVAAATCPAAPR